MTVHGVGVDIVDIARFRSVWATYGPSLERRWFDPSELEGPEEVPRQLACCLAVKEAVWKALAPSGLPHLVWREIVTTAVPGPVVGVELRGRVLGAAQLLGVGSIRASAAISGNMAMATAIAQRAVA